MSENASMPEMLSIRETAKRTGLSPYLLRRLIAEKRIVCITCGKKYLVNLSSVIALLNGAETTESNPGKGNYAE